MKNDEIKNQIKDELKRIKERGVLVVVEGKKDKTALEKLGLTNTLILKKPLFEIVEDIAKTEKEVVLLTDLDDEGKKLYSIISKDLQKHKVKINNKIRNLLFTSELRHIEGIDTFLAQIHKP